MKVRCGFVSNSSSSSFMIWGAAFNPQELEEMLIKSGKYTEEDFVDGAVEALYNISGTVGLDVEEPEYHESVYIGRCPTSMDDDETMWAWKEGIDNKIREMLGLPDDFELPHVGWHEDCSYNG